MKKSISSKDVVSFTIKQIRDYIEIRENAYCEGYGEDGKVYTKAIFNKVYALYELDVITLDKYFMLRDIVDRMIYEN